LNPKSTTFEHLDHFLTLSNQPQELLHVLTRSNRPPNTLEATLGMSAAAVVVGAALAGGPSECHAAASKSLSQDENSNTFEELVGHDSKVSQAVTVVTPSYPVTRNVAGHSAHSFPTAVPRFFLSVFCRVFLHYLLHYLFLVFQPHIFFFYYISCIPSS
jgi:hypothetical protein